MLCLSIPIINEVEVGEKVLLFINDLNFGELEVVEKSEKLNLMGIRLNERTVEYLDTLRKEKEEALIKVAAIKEIN